MYKRHCLFLGLIAAAFLSAQDSQPTVQVTGAVKQALTFSADDLAKMPRVTVKTTSGGMDTVYDGVWLHDVLKAAGVPQGSELRGKALSSYVLAKRRTAMKWCSLSANSTPVSSTMKFCWPIPRMASRYPARRDVSDWLCPRTNRQHARSACSPRSRSFR